MHGQGVMPKRTLADREALRSGCVHAARSGACGCGIDAKLGFQLQTPAGTYAVPQSVAMHCGAECRCVTNRSQYSVALHSVMATRDLPCNSCLLRA